MFFHWLLREPTLCFRLTVYLCAGLLFPLHLGWIGASWPALFAYLVLASLLLATPVALLTGPLPHAKWQAFLLVAALTAALLALPASLAFGLGSVLGPIDEAFDETICATQGLSEADTAASEVNDTVDVMPDCLAAG